MVAKIFEVWPRKKGSHWAHLASHWRCLRCHSCLGTIDVDRHQHQARKKNPPKKRGEKTESVAIWWTNIWFLCQKTAYIFFAFDFGRIVNNKILTQIRFGCQTVCIFLLNWGVIEGWEFPRNFVVWDWGLHISIFWERNGNQGDTNHSSYSPLKI